MKIKKSVLKKLVKEVLEEQKLLKESARIKDPMDLYSEISDGKHKGKFNKYYKSLEYQNVPIALVFRYFKLTTKDLLRLEKRGEIDHWINVDEKARTFSVGVD
jgi:hypothetical protein